jgi:transposase
MRMKRTDEFRAEAVRIALPRGLTRKQVASDLGVGLSTLRRVGHGASRPRGGIRLRL